MSRFTATRWSLIRRTASADPTVRGEALEDLCRSYWYPLYAYGRSTGGSAVDTEDEVQAFFTHLLEADSLGRADPERGRFRTFLLTAFRNYRSNERAKQQTLRRGGGVRKDSIDWQEGEDRYAVEPVDHVTPEVLFERAWAQTLLRAVLEELRASYAARDQEHVFDGLAPVLSGGDVPYAEVAERLGLRVESLRVAAHRLRERYRETLFRRVADTLEDPSEVKRELENLTQALKSL